MTRANWVSQLISEQCTVVCMCGFVCAWQRVVVAEMDLLDMNNKENKLQLLTALT